jgi:ABC-2 type transport system ATP-binding protein
MTPRAELIGISKRYGESIALDDVNLSIRPGEILVLVGPNGAGKTTLTRILATLLRPNEGKVFVDGVDALTDPITVRRGIAIVPQGVTPDPYTTVWEHVCYYLQARGLYRNVATSRAETTLQALDLWDKRDVRALRLSGGFQRRVVLAMALATQPRLLLLDEPSMALDPGARRQLWSMLAAVRSDTSILLTTHDMKEAEMLSDRIALIGTGRLVAVDTLAALLRRLPSTEKLLIEPGPGTDLELQRYGDVQQVAGRKVIYPHDAKAAKAIAVALVGSGASFSAQPTDLEDCYFHLLTSSDPASQPASRR